jgi:putative Mn2+ efflux pump MntP
MDMGMEGVTFLAAVVLVPAFTATFVLAGLLLGSRLSQRTGRYATLAGGSLLIGIAQYYCFA